MIKPPILPSFLAMFFVVLMTSLGFWQLDRAKQKEQMLELMLNEKSTQITDVNQINLLPRYSVVKLNGLFDDRFQFFLDNQFQDKKVGYHVFSPFYLDDLKTYIMINRGWIEKNQSEKLKPLASQKRSINGRLSNPPKVGIQLGEIQLIEKPQQTITYYEGDKINTFIKNQLCNVEDCMVAERILWLDETERDGFIRKWNPVIMLPEKHYGYAFQWFSMTLVLIILFFYWLRKQHKC